MVPTLNAQRLCLYDVEWQCLRVSLLGSWTSLHQVERNLEMLSAYIYGGVPISEAALISRMYRVLNLLNAVRMGHHGLQMNDTEISQAIVIYRDTLSDQYAYTEDGIWNGCEHGWEAPDEYKILDDLKHISRALAQEILSDFLKRRSLAIYKTRSKSRQEAIHKVQRSRPELCWAIRVYSAALGKRYDPLEAVA